MGVKATTNVENKPKATVKNLQFVENLDKLIGIAEKAEENGDTTKGKHRSSYDLVNVRSLYIERYDWFDTVFEAGGKYGILDSYCNDLYVAPQYDNIEFIDMEQPYTVTKDGVQGVINEAGTFMTDEEALDYEGYLVGEYDPGF